MFAIQRVIFASFMLVCAVGASGEEITRIPELPAVPIIPDPNSPAAPVPDAPTFTKDVAPILFENCTQCHRTGQIGPFKLLNYEDARKRATQLAEVTRDRIMPPWKPLPGFGEFSGARKLTPVQIATLKKWADAGAPEGPPEALPALPKFKDGWQLGTPDVILTMPKAFTIPAEGRDLYMHFVMPIPIQKERYIKAVEVLPGNRRVAHHAVGLLDSSGTARKLQEKAGGHGYEKLGSSGFLPAGMTPGYVPGQTPRFFRDDYAIAVKPGMDFVLQMHYHPSGKVEEDLTQVGFYFTDKKPQGNFAGLLLGSESIDIPAGAARHVVRDSIKIPAAITLNNAWAHMHMVGKEVCVWADLPDGKKQPLLWINDWDFNWQDSYEYTKPVRLPKDTVVHAVFTYDNTANNPHNPNTPPMRVRHGEGSTDEMAGVFLGGTCDSGWDGLSLLAAGVGHFLEVNSNAKKFKAEMEKQDREAAKRPGFPKGL